MSADLGLARRPGKYQREAAVSNNFTTFEPAPGSWLLACSFPDLFFLDGRAMDLDPTAGLCLPHRLAVATIPLYQVHR